MALRVLAGYADGGLAPETYRALVKNVPIGSLELVNVSGGISNYWHEFRKRWVGKYDLMTVEQDNVITPEIIPSFNMCDELWCTYSYIGPPHMTDRTLTKSLGCTRFSTRLQREVPIQEISDKDYFSWYLIDYRLAVVLGEKGYEPHVHGEVEHLHPYVNETRLIDQEKRLFKESQEVTKRNPSAVLAHVGLDLEDGIAPEKDSGSSPQGRKPASDS